MKGGIVKRWAWAAFALVLGVTDARAFTYLDLVDVITRRGLQRLEDVLPYLPASLRAHYTLVYRSHSLQEASYDYPRAVLFGRDARFIVTFNGNPAQRGYSDLEILQFNEDRREFELYRIAFEDRVQYSQKNPPRCLVCHGRRPGPIWSSYEYGSVPDGGHWPGVYGSIHDAPGRDALEADAFDRFRVRARRHPRYRNLPLDHPDSAWFPYGAGAHQHRFRPNNRLGNLLGRLNARRIAARIRSAKFYQSNPNLVWLWLLNCPQAGDPQVLRWLEDLDGSRLEGVAPRGRDRSSAAVSRTVRIAGLFEALLTGPEIDGWNLSLANRNAKPAARYSTGIIDIGQLVSAALLQSEVSNLPFPRKYYKRIDNRALYDGFAPGYYGANVEPGGVGADYDALGTLYDRTAARGACSRLWSGARSEMAHGDRTLRGAGRIAITSENR